MTIGIMIIAIMAIGSRYLETSTQLDWCGKGFNSVAAGGVTDESMNNEPTQQK